SSRRRHTISNRDWSSDVCSSDLNYWLKSHLFGNLPRLPVHIIIGMLIPKQVGFKPVVLDSSTVNAKQHAIMRLFFLMVHVQKGEIGRASCRERVEVRGGGVAER